MDNNPVDEGMKKVVISMNPQRQEALDYNADIIDGCRYEESPVWVKKNFDIMYNEHDKGESGKHKTPAFDEATNIWTSLPAGRSKAKNRMGCFGAHTNALQYVVDNKIDNVAILEDDAQIDRRQMGIRAGETFDTSGFPQDAPTLLGATFRHPKSWGKDNEWRKNTLPKLIPKFKKGVNPLNYDDMRWSQAHAIYYPTHQVAGQLLDKIKQIGAENKKKLGSGPYKHYDLFLGENRLIPYFHYPSLFTHNDGIDEYRNPKAVGSSIGKGEGIVKNYIQMGKTPSIIQEHTPPFECKTMMGNPVKASRRTLRQRSKG